MGTFLLSIFVVLLLVVMVLILSAMGHLHGKVDALRARLEEVDAHQTWQHRTSRSALCEVTGYNPATQSEGDMEKELDTLLKQLSGESNEQQN